MYYLFLFSLTFLRALLEEEYTCANVAQVDSKNAETELSKHKLTLMLFYAPWCGHCKRLMPDYDALCKDVKEKLGSDALCARVDCTTSEDVCERQKLKGYPTIKTFKGKEVCEYEGPRVGSSIFTWFRSQYYSSNDIEDIKTAKELLSSSEHSLVAFVYPESDLRGIVSTIGCKIDDTLFLVVSDPDIAKELGFTKPDTFAIFNKDKLDHVLDETTNPDDVLRSVFFLVNPIVPDYSPEYVPHIFSNFISHYVGYIYETEETLSKVRSVLEEYARSKIPSLRIFTVNSSDEGNRDVVNFFSLEKIPSVIFYDDQKQKFYHMQDADITPDNLEAFVQGCINGSIQPYVKKQPVSEGWDEGAVKILVVDNFQEPFEKYESGIVLFYAPWCGHCEAFMPAWEEFGKFVQENYPKIFVGKMDHTENELSGVEISGYPTVIAFRDSKTQIAYTGGRTLDDLKKFILETFIETKAEEKTLEDEEAGREDL